MEKSLKAVFLVGAAALLVGCGGGGGGSTVNVASADAELPTNATVATAVANTPFAFPAGVPALGTTGTTTVAFTSTSTTPAFSIASSAGTATGATTFGSCIFAVTSSTFPAGHALAQGNTVTVNPCNIRLGTAGAVANGVAQNRSVALVLGAASSSGQSVSIGVNAGGQLTLNGNVVGTVTLTPVSG